MRQRDGSAGDVDYEKVGVGYSRYRRPEPQIAETIRRALGDSRRVLNVGAGAGSYEPADRDVTAVEPSASMRAQRPPHLPTAIDATAEQLPFPDDAFDASLATFTVHQWQDLKRGLAEMRRVTRGPVVVLTCDPQKVRAFWLYDYCPEVLDAEARRYPPLSAIMHALGRGGEVVDVPIPLNCTDGFNEAYYGRPEILLDPAARSVCSAWAFVPPSALVRFETALRRDLEAGTWDEKYRHLRTQHEYPGSLRLVLGKD